MEFDKLTIVFLNANPDAPKLDDAAMDQLQDAHMANLTRMHVEGLLLAAGPMMGDPDRQLRGICFHSMAPDEARASFDSDPFVRAGQLIVEAHTWMVPSGLIAFSRGKPPRSQAEL
jgi:uncharacterized protein YciI